MTRQVLIGAYLLLLSFSPATAQMGEMERFNRKARPMHKDVPYLECSVCKRSVEELWNLTDRVRKHAADNGLPKIGEDDLIDFGSLVCDPDTDEGEWINMIDIVQDGPGSSVKLKQEEYMGECRRECRTIQHACNKVFDEYREDVAELLWKGEPATVEKLASRVCSKWAKMCPAKAVPKTYDRKDEFWYPMDEDSWKMRNMEKTMNQLTSKHGKQPVKFVDPMGGMMMGSDGWDDDEEGMDPMAAMMGGFGGEF